MFFTLSEMLHYRLLRYKKTSAALELIDHSATVVAKITLINYLKKQYRYCRVTFIFEENTGCMYCE